jgi:hypothetical protein
MQVEMSGGKEWKLVETAKTVVHIEEEDMSLGLYLMEHDTTYIVDRCFHIKIYWIYARGPTVQERIVKRLYRRVKEFGGDCFRVMPISVIIKEEHLNPFESSVILRNSSIDKRYFNAVFKQQLRS